jgi:transcriptional regulator with XRE-family HTH domain
MFDKQPHYLRSCRRRGSLSQRDIAFLLGVKTISKISRYERKVMLPPVRTALAYEVIFGRPLAKLFHGAYDRIRADVRRRARRLAEKTSASLHSTLDLRRKESLKSILNR